MTNAEEKTTNQSILSKLSGWPLLLLLVGLVWLAANPGADVEAVHCETKQHADSVDVVMLSAEWCTYCRRARRLFVNEKISYCEHDIERSEMGQELYRQSKVKVIPIIRIQDDTLVGFSKNEILQTLASYDLYPLENI